MFQVPKGDSAELDVNEVGGMFVILILGCLLGFIFCLLEFLWNIRKVAVEEKVILLHYNKYIDYFIIDLKYVSFQKKMYIYISFISIENIVIY